MKIVGSEHVEMFLDEYAVWTIDNRDRLMNDELLEGGHS